MPRMSSAILGGRRVATALVLLVIPRAAIGQEDFAKPGPYPVGVRTVVLIDSSRKDDFAGGPRTLVTEVWYPAVEEARGMPKLRFSDFFGPYRELGAKALKRDLEAIDRDFHTLGVRGAGLREGKWPLLIFSHGNGGFRHQNVFQMDHLASHGYVVAAPDHTGNASLTPLPGGAVGYDRKGRARSAEDRPRDVTFLIDRLSAADLPETAWARGALDLTALGVLGHSFGGFTAVRAGELDHRIRAVLAMTVAFPGEPTSIPTMVMLGAEDSTVGLGGNMLSRGYFLGLKGSRYLFVLKRGGHFTFSEMAVVNPNFGDGVGHGKGRGGKEMDFIPTQVARDLINSYTLAFFDLHLRGDKLAGEFLRRNSSAEELEWWVGDRQIGGHEEISGSVEPPAIPPKPKITNHRSERF
jgi:platelet-activating factor acetylhydrolase isoform II